MKDYKAFMINTLTNTHLGSGESHIGVIDNLVQKDPVTSVPVFHASGIKGAFRWHFRDNIGIDKDQSSRWQAIASIPEEIFEEHIKGTVEAEKELTSAGLLNVARDIKCKQRQEERKEAILRETLSAEESGIYCSDCIKFMKDHMADGTVDLTITSPPYDHLRSYEIYTFDFEAIAQELFRITKDGGVLVWIAGDAVVNSSETGSSFRQALYFMEVGFSLWDTMIYQKAATSYPSIGRYQQIFEYMFVLSKNRPKAFNPICDVPKLWEGSWGHTTRRRQDGSLDTQTIKEGNELKMRSNIWRYHNGKGMGTRDDLVVLHPASFPEKLAKDHILSWSNPGDLVFDPMCGSGTTLKMASSNNRKFLGIDVCEEYCQIARKRIAAMDGPK